MLPWLSDETWEALDHDAGALDRRSSRRVAVLVLIGCLVFVAVVAGRESGLISPRVSVAYSSTSVQPGAVVEHVLLWTQGSFDERLIGVGTDRPGLTVTATTSLPARIPQNTSLDLTLRYVITDCTAASHHALSVSLHLHRFWGTITQTLTLAGSTRFVAQACAP